jgi:hypothetical protein
MAMPTAGAISIAGLGIARAPQGVDLNLNQFSLDAVEKRVDGKWMCEPDDEVAAPAMAEAFWSSVDSSSSEAFEKEDLALFKIVFNPNLSDRRAEGKCFTTPDTSEGYIDKLYSLVNKEDETRQLRREEFFRVSFKHDSPGPLFPISWAPSLEVAGTQAEHPLSQGGSLLASTDYHGEAEEIVRSATALFHKKTEEGSSFRIYRVGSLEVRTVQDHDGEETIGAVFTVKAVANFTEKGASRCARPNERILKATEYVHKRHAGNSQDSDSEDLHYYVVFETECGNTIVSEQLSDGAVRWEENVKELEVRNGLAKVIRFSDCSMGVTVQQMKMYCGQVLQRCQQLPSKHGKAYATSSFAVAVGGPQVALRAP